MKKRYTGLEVLFALLLLIAALVPCNASPRVPEAAEINTEALNIAVRSALGCAVNYILTKSETNHLGLLAQPVRQSKITGYAGTTNIVTRFTQKITEVRYTEKESEIRYAMKRFDEPVWEYQYEKDKSLAVGASDTRVGRGGLGKVTNRRIVGQKQVGTQVVMKKVLDPKGDIVEKRKDLVPDPQGKIVVAITNVVPDANGTIVQTTTQNINPIYDDAPDIWTEGLVGQNAMVLLALLKSGVPEDNHVVSQMVKSLNDYVCNYGSPDTTWDLAWLATAFANIHSNVYKRTGEILISKVLDGQITEGSARGLWGPVCINTTLLSAMIAHEQNLVNELANMKDLLTKSPNSKTYIRNVEEAETRLNWFKAIYKDFTQQGLRFLEVTQNYTIAPIAYRHATVPGLPFYFYNQMLADMESTSLALYAIREAAENGCLPNETIRPMISPIRTPSPILKTSELKRPELPKSAKSSVSSMGIGISSETRQLIPPENTSVILARAAAAISSRQKADGIWDEVNIHQANKSFEALGLSPVKEDALCRLDSSKSLLSTAQAYAALLDAGRSAGLDKMRHRYGDNLHNLVRKAIPEVSTVLPGFTFRTLNTVKSENIIVGRHGAAYRNTLFVVQVSFGP